MARRSTTKSTAETRATVEKSTVANVEMVDNEVKTQEKETVVRTVKETPLNDSDEIQVVSLIPNVSYLDSKTNDYYEWEGIGHIEYMTVDVLKNMWRNHKSYFRNMWLKPLDERIVKLFGLKVIYDKYEFLMKESNYTRDNIKKIIDMLTASSTTNGLKFSVTNMVKNAVMNGRISDVVVIKALENQLNLDLISFL